MKKNILKATLVAAFALIAGYNVYSSQKAEGMSELALANVEALASEEGGG
ncbi:NVEALA domain-containing protein, partial [uncultured Phocaeicola sp.]